MNKQQLKQQRKQQQYEANRELFHDIPVEDLFYEEVCIQGNYWSILSTYKSGMKEDIKKKLCELKRELEGKI